ncbi:MAG: hypothetical protein QOJ01_825 [Solirubrobacterales bacterium]|nr:hypothetical protein [Solirubrobacterales bacterium]
MSIHAITPRRSLVLATALGFALTGCGSSGSSTSTGAASATSTSEAQSAATGDIPDNQQFLSYRDRKAGYSVKYPEGWARTGAPADLTFADKDNQVHIAVTSGQAPNPAAAKAALLKSAAASSQLKVKTATTMSIGGAPAVHITYEELGKSDPVTGKRLTIMVDRYVFAKGGQVATMDESTPVGVDNVDAYRLIAQSFKWS